MNQMPVTIWVRTKTGYGTITVDPTGHVILNLPKKIDPKTKTPSEKIYEGMCG